LSAQFNDRATAERVAARLTKLRGEKHRVEAAGSKFVVRGMFSAAEELKEASTPDQAVIQLIADVKSPPGGKALDYPVTQISPLIGGPEFFYKLSPDHHTEWKGKDLAFCVTKLVAVTNKFYLIEVPGEGPGTRWLGKSTMEWHDSQPEAKLVRFIVKVAVLKKNNMLGLLKHAAKMVPEIG
jgi:hypothetical protein